MIACDFQQEQFQPHMITGHVIFSQLEFEKNQKLGLRMDVCPETKATAAAQVTELSQKDKSQIAIFV